MGMNRYDNGSVSAYTPQTMQELAFVPMMQREKHDKLLAEQEAIRAGLAKVNPLNVHYNRAVQLKKDIESQIDTQAEELAKHGVSNDMTGKVISLNRQYNDLVSPTGEIGQINTAKEVRDKTREEHIKAALASHQSYADAVRNWDNYEKNNYTGYSADKSKIVNIDSLGVPEMIDPIKHLDDLAVHAGFKDDSWKKGTSGLVDTGIAGANRYVVNEQTAHKSGTNVENLKALATLFNQEVNDPTTPLRQSLKYQNRDINSVLNQASSQLGIYNKTQIDNEHSIEKTNVDWNKSSEDPNNPSGFGITEASNNFVSDKYSDKTYSDIQNIIDKNKNSKTPEGKQSFYEATTFKNKLDKSLKENKDYVNLIKQKDDLLNKLNIPKIIKEQIKKANNGITTLFHDTGVGTTSMLIDGKKIFLKRDDLNKIQKYEDDLNKIFSKKSEIINNTLLHNNVSSTDYKLTAFTPKQNSILKLANQNIQSLFQTNPENIKAYVNIENVGTEEGNIMHNISSDDKEVLAKVLSRAGSVKLQTVTDKGISGKPEYVLRVTPNDEDEELLGTNSWISQSHIGNKPIDIRVSFKQNTNKTEIDNVNDLITNQYLPLAGKKGQNLATSMKAYARYGNSSYGEFQGDKNVDSRVQNLIEQEVIKNQKSPYANLTLKEAIKRYYQHHKDELINFHDN